MPINPVTREEKILAGEEIQPKTRFEYFLRRLHQTAWRLL